ncbi:unnamed protein product [Urochloa humidicola]
MNNGALGVPDDHRGGGGFLRLRNRRLRAGLYVAAWGAAGILSNTVPGLPVNPDQAFLYFVVLIAGVLLLLLSLLDLPWGQRAAARLEGMLEAMF